MNSVIYFTSAEVAKRFRVKETTVQRWIRQGCMSALDLGSGNRTGPYIISEADLKEFEDSHYKRSDSCKKRRAFAV